MSSVTDTIAALATPAGTSALAVIRVSGPLCSAIYQAALGGRGAPRPRFSKHAHYLGTDGSVLDDVVATYFVAPHSYSGDDTLEISTHGNPFIAQRVLEDLFARGCRAAEPGEFTRRAFLNGKLDLSQAEAVMDLIHARSERALRAANQQLKGSLGRHLEQLIEMLLGVLARVEAYIDFPDEDLPPEDRRFVADTLGRLSAGTERLLATEHYGAILREGIRTVILGEPNAGKSSLLNRLVGRERALVSAEPGTTRDFIEERILIGAHSIRLIDTAGLNSAPAPLEKLGIEKTYERVEEADLFLVVLDAGRPTPVFPPQVLEKLKVENTVVVLNKTDLGVAVATATTLPSSAVVPVSALAGTGIQELCQAVELRAEALRSDHGDEIIAINARHAEALGRAKGSLSHAAEKLSSGGPVELLASDLREALTAYGEIGGRVDNERMLDHLFATFCIGK